MSQHTMIGRKIPFANRVNYVRKIFDKKIVWRLQIKMVGVNALQNLLEHTSYSKLSDEAIIPYTPVS
jgi:hypothetical protein